MENGITEGRAKLRFIALYGISLVLIFVVVSSFWQKGLESQAMRESEEIKATNESLMQEVESLRKQVAQKDQAIVTLQNASQQNTPPMEGNLGQASSTSDEKDKVIASLKNQLQEKNAALQQALTSGNAGVANNASDDGEWKQKYTSLKKAFDKVSENEKVLKSAYKTIADDNRRLLNQLQSLRKG